MKCFEPGRIWESQAVGGSTEITFGTGSTKKPPKQNKQKQGEVRGPFGNSLHVRTRGVKESAGASDCIRHISQPLASDKPLNSGKVFWLMITPVGSA